ncbi:MAG TPA: DUF1553 domain-containing protein [Verrucomicrobiae bacterium]|nr:DUF1553 domain-containing protein [Verrucomicrobiae bacterium]
MAASDAPEEKPKRLPGNHWSLQPLKSSKALEASLGSAEKLAREKVLSQVNPIDAFVSARLATNGLKSSPPASRPVLLRRLTFDLTGLPPTPQEIDEFVKDRSPHACDSVVERLLASPRYGERWARHWLDAARYTESQGFEYDKLRDNAWHYRDYVIRSLNEDKPYNQFMREQIAGDVLEPITTDGIIAASLLVCGPWDEAGNSQANATQKALTREEEMEDMLSVVGQTFLGLTVNCARCHDHKFDPIPQKDYYRLKAVFEGVKHGERTIANSVEIKSREEKSADLKTRIARAEETVSRLEAEGWKAAAGKRRSDTTAPGPDAYLRWQFDSATNGWTGELHGGASVGEGRLRLPKEGAYFQSAPLTGDLREKTLAVWVALGDRQQRGGAAISIENSDGSVFDAIVYGERQAGKWMAGSSGFERTRDLDAPEESSGPGVLVHMAIVYRADNSIAVFRNGEAYGKPYTPASELRTYRAGQARVLLGMRHTGGSKPFLTGEIKEAAIYERALTPEEVAASYRAAGLSISRSEILDNLTKTQREGWEAARADLKSAREALGAIPPLPVSYAGTRIQPEPTKFLRRGDVRSPENVITAAGLSAVREVEAEFGLGPEAPEAQRRIKFAEWLCAPGNPLPARVMANRIWYLHFGQGLVATPNDFGASGTPPTHPELLDWLAAKFIESGWSVKSLHRLITLSSAYRQSSEPQAKALQIDADNLLLWRYAPRRLEAEAVRDAILAVSGQLNLTMGGPSFRPFDVLKFPANAYQPVDKIGPEYNRRAVYRMNVNSGKEPLLDAFDCPDPSVKTPRRGVTTTPLQALALMNNSFVQRHAGHLAERAMKESQENVSQAVHAAYRLALGRPPSNEEARRALAVVNERSLTNVCWALLNSTEFVYVR